MKKHRIRIALFKRKWLTGLLSGVLTITSVFSALLYMNRMKADVTSPDLVTERFGKCPTCQDQYMVWAQASKFFGSTGIAAVVKLQPSALKTVKAQVYFKEN